MPTHSQCIFELAHTRVQLRSHLRAVVDWAAHDFRGFLLGPRTVDLRLEILPAAQRAGRWWRVWHTRHSQIFWGSSRLRRVCFFESAFIEYDFSGGECRIFCDDAERAYEAFYEVVLSFVGERLDDRGLHRLHALAVHDGGQPLVVLGASGAGKSTLALGVWQSQKAVLWADDTPLVDYKGRVHPFALRMALSQPPAGLPARKFSRIRHPAKYVVGVEPVLGATPALPRLWVLQAQAPWLPKSWVLAWCLTKWLIIGWEVPQIWELYLRFSPLLPLKVAQHALSRAQAALALWWNCELSWLPRSDTREETLRHFLQQVGEPA